MSKPKSSEGARQAFAATLRDLMAQREMSQSDLARAIWGTVVTSSGASAARNRDLISKYLQGVHMPGARMLKKLGDALGTDVTTFAPCEPTMRVAGIASRPNVVRIVLEVSMPEIST